MVEPVDTSPVDIDNLSAQDAATIYRDFSVAQVLFHSTVAEILGLSPGDYKCLDLLMRAGGPLTATALAQLCGLTTGAVTGVVDRLERAKYAVRTRDDIDRRRVMVKAADGVETRLAWIFESLGVAIDELEAGFDREELTVIRRYMYRATEVFQEQTALLREQARELHRQ
jgi:DNA-binding MarR family transcriptional regulator